MTAEMTVATTGTVVMTATLAMTGTVVTIATLATTGTLAMIATLAMTVAGRNAPHTGNALGPHPAVPPKSTIVAPGRLRRGKMKGGPQGTMIDEACMITEEILTLILTAAGRTDDARSGTIGSTTGRRGRMEITVGDASLASASGFHPVCHAIWTAHAFSTPCRKSLLSVPGYVAGRDLYTMKETVCCCSVGLLRIGFPPMVRGLRLSPVPGGGSFASEWRKTRRPTERNDDPRERNGDVCCPRAEPS